LIRASSSLGLNGFGSHFQTDDPVGLLRHRGEKNDGDLGLRPKFPAKRQAIVPRHHDVEDEQIGRAGIELAAESRDALGRAHSVAVLAEVAHQQLPNVLVVVNDRDVKRRRHDYESSPRIIRNRARES